MRFAFPVFFTLFLSIACSNETDKQIDYENVDPIELARPDGIEIPPQELSEADHRKLAMAKGRTANQIAVDSFVTKVRKSRDRLFVYHFWKMDCPECLKMNKRLSKLADEIGRKKLYIELVNLDDFSRAKELNTYIRKENITLNTIQVDTKAENFSLIDNAFKLRWNKEIPAMFLVNHSNGTNLHYQKAFEYDELYAIIQPLTL